MTGELFDLRRVGREAGNISAAGSCALLMLCSSVRAQQNDMPPRVTGARAAEAATRLDYIFDGSTAIRLMPPEMVVGQGVTRAEWSPDGRFALAVRAPAVTETLAALPVSLAVWDKRTRRAVEVWRRRLTTPVLTGPTQWLANAQVGIVRWQWMDADENGAWSIREGMVWVNAAQGVAREVDGRQGDVLYLSPEQNGCVILHGKPQFLLQSLSVIAPDGSFTPDLPAPEGARGLKQTRWQPDGKQFFVELDMAEKDKPDNAKAEDPGSGGTFRKQWFAIDMAHPGFAALNKEPDGTPALPGSVAPTVARPESRAGSLRIRPAPTALKQGSVETTIHPLWLESGSAKPMAALLCADGAQAKIAPSGDAVLYLCRDSMWVTALQRAPRAAFIASVLAPHQDDARYRAWTLAQAARMWRDAHKGVLPAPEEALAAFQSLMPTEALYEGFRYVWKGGALPPNVRPAETVVAEILGPGGSAQIFADGHSAWKSGE